MYLIMVLIMFGCWAIGESHETAFIIAAGMFAIADAISDIPKANKNENQKDEDIYHD